METSNNIDNIDKNQDGAIDSSELLSEIQTLDEAWIDSLISILNNAENSELENSLKTTLSSLWTQVENWEVELNEVDKVKLIKLYSSINQAKEEPKEEVKEEIKEEPKEKPKEKEQIKEVKQEVKEEVIKKEKVAVEPKEQLKHEEIKGKKEKNKWISKYNLEVSLEKLENWEKLDEEAISDIKDFIKEQRENYDSEEMETLFQKVETEIDFSDKTLDEHKNNIEKFLYQNILNTLTYTPDEKNNLVSEIDKYLEDNYEKLDLDNNWSFNEQERIEMVNWVKELIASLLNWNDKWIEKTLEELIDNNFKIEYSVDLDIWKKSYRSIDNYNPVIDVNEDYSDELWKVVEQYRLIWNNLTTSSNKFWKVSKDEFWVFKQDLNKVEWNQLENSPEENKKILDIINEFYKTNKDVIYEKLWIKDITKLTPSEAAKLVTLITMSKLDYDHSQAIYPWNEGNYFEWLDNSEKNEYKESLLISHIMSPLLWCETNGHIKTNFLKTNDYSSLLNKLNLNNIDCESLSFDDIKNKWNDIASNILKNKWFSSNNINRVLQFAYESNTYSFNAYSNTEFWKRLTSWNDMKTVSELLEWWDGICRNYAIANEKLFEALKTVQSPKNNMLKNSALIYYSWNQESNVKWNIANMEDGTKNHAWNTLVTIWKDWTKYIAQVDSTHADTWWTEWWIWKKWNIDSEIAKVLTIDRTFDRLLNDVADWTNDKWFEDIDNQLNTYIKTLEKSWWDMSKIILLKSKLIDFYSWLWKTEELNKVRGSIRNNLSW